MKPRSFGWITAVACALAAQTAGAGETVGTLDLVTYTAPDGWNVAEKAGHVELVRVGADSYCMIIIYPSTPASGDLSQSFAGEWKAVALQTIAPVAAPAVTLSEVGNTRAAMGGARSTSGGKPIVAVLVVLDAGASVVSMLMLAPSMEAMASYASEVKELTSRLVVRRVEAAPAAPAAAQSGGKPVVPAPTRAITIADLTGEWKNDDRFMQTYVNRYTGDYAGFDSFASREQWTITAKGTISQDFFGIQNGRKIADKATGTVTISPVGVLSIRRSTGQTILFLVRGWLARPDVTVMKLIGPWYDEIPQADLQEHLQNPGKGENLSQYWVRKSRPKAED